MSLANIFGLAFIILFNVGPLFQMAKIVRNRCSYNNSYGMWVCGTLGQMCVMSYYISLGVPGAFNYINCVIGMILGVAMLLLIYVYRKQK